MLSIAASTLAVTAVPLAALATGGDAGSPADAAAAVKSIQSTADRVVAGKYAGKHMMRGPAREIALAWERAEPIYSKNGNVLVETHVLNLAITSFESDWKTDYSKSQADAKDVSQAAATLLASATPSASAGSAAPATSPGAPAPAPSGANPKR